MCVSYITLLAEYRDIPKPLWFSV